MNEVTVEEYMGVLNGDGYGGQYSKNYYIISRKDKNKQTQKQILLKEGVGLPPNLNENYEENRTPMRKKRKVDPSILRQMQYKKK